ncbi:MAG TPA: YIP1 family protein [Thermoanaerobaculia bacterium]|nr:YIP1 family protein [Thermoanaerobaculia bacterium]
MKDSSLGRLLGVLLAPGDTFQSIAGRPTWVLPLLVLVLLGGAVQWLLQTRVDPDELFREQIRRVGVELSPQQMEKAQEQQARSGSPKAKVIFGVLLVAVLNFVVAAMFWMGFRLFGSEIEYVPALSTTLYGFVPLGLAALLNTVVILARGSVEAAEVLSGGVLPSNLGFFAPEDSGLVAQGMLQSVDLFSIWTIVLLVIGFRITAKVSRGTAIGVVLGIWLIGIALKAGLLALPALLMGGGS